MLHFNNKHGNCKAQFPRQIFEKTEVDPKTGALNIKKGERWINTLTPIVTYLLRCNSDVTSLLSGTEIEAIVAYISDYVTKPNLNLYWKSYVTEVLKAWKQDGEVLPDKVILLKNVDGEFIGLSVVDDYKYRLYELSNKSLYEWIQIYERL